jgi:rSAM/selenodomain-associated transferase 1
MKAHERILVLMARQPQYGVGKRRLAKGLGNFGAWIFYKRSFAGLIRRMGIDTFWNPVMALTPDTAARKITPPENWTVVEQGQGDLGDRMSLHLHAAPGPVVFIGTDLPDISVADIRLAFKQLENADAVFGPAKDGGYWLVGLKNKPKVLDPFHPVRWSSEHTLADTIANLPLGAKISFLDERDDIDDLSAYNNWRHQ